MQRFPKGLIGHSEQKADDEEREEDDEPHPRERHYRGEDTAWEILMAPVQVAP